MSPSPLVSVDLRLCRAMFVPLSKYSIYFLLYSLKSEHSLGKNKIKGSVEKARATPPTLCLKGHKSLRILHHSYSIKIDTPPSSYFFHPSLPTP